MQPRGYDPSVADALRNISIVQSAMQLKLQEVQQTLFQKTHVDDLITPNDWKPCWKEKLCTLIAPCKFEGPGLVCGLERDTQRQIFESLPASATVLEVGSRFGTVSCTISKKQENSGLRLSMEPDKDAFGHLNANVALNRCAGMQVNGVVSHSNASLSGSFYATSAGVDAHGGIRGYLPVDLEQMLAKRVGHPVQFDVLFLDCEGCAFGFIKEHEEFLRRSTLQRVYLEADIDAWSSYRAKFLPLMCSYGFDVEEDAINTTCCPKIHHVVFSRTGKCSASNLRGMG